MKFVIIIATNYIIKELKLFARRACSFSLLRSSKEKILSAYICVRLRLIKNPSLLWSLANKYSSLGKLQEGRFCGS